MAFINTLKRAFGLTGEVDEEDFDDVGFNAVGYDRPSHQYKSALPRHADKPIAQHDRPKDDTQGMADDVTAHPEPDDKRTQDIIRKISAERDAAQQARLSAERQKRALTDRLYDLESRFAEAENDCEKLYTENKRLKVQLKRAMPAGADSALLDVDDEDIKARDEKIAALSQALNEARQENVKLKRDVDTIKMKCDLAEVMVDELQKQASTSKRELDNARKELETLRKHSAVPLVKNDNEDVKMQCELRIAELQRIISLKEKEIRSLNSTIEHNLRRHAENEALLRNEIASLRKGLLVEPEPQVTESAEVPTATDVASLPRKKKKLFSKKSKRNKKSSDSDNDDAQMSLW